MIYKPKGIIHITGEHDTGKTIAALGLCNPKETTYIFDDVKAPPLDPQEFGYYCNLTENPLKMIELYHHVNSQILNNIPNKIKYLIFDTWSGYGKSVRYYAKANPLEFREKSTFAPNGTIRNMEQWSEAHNVEGKIISQLATRFETVVLITHLKPQNLSGVRTGKEIPDSGKSLNKVCNLRLWLRHNPYSGVPIALVLKRISKLTVKKGDVEVVNVLPRRIEPLESESSIWQSVDRYWNNPFGNREPLKNEEPNEFELSILDGFLTGSQKEVWKANIEAAKAATLEEQMEQDQLVEDRIKELKGTAIPEIIKIVKEEFNRGIKPPEIIKLHKKL